MNTSESSETADIPEDISVILHADVIGSRSAFDLKGNTAPYALQQAMLLAQKTVNEKFNLSEDINIQQGDAFYGEFRSISDAVAGALIIRLIVLTRVGFDIRSGIGIGDQSLQLADPFHSIPKHASLNYATQAVNYLKDQEIENEEFSTRTHVLGHGEYLGISHSFNAYLMMRDALIDSLEYKEKLVLLGAILEKEITEIAEENIINSQETKRIFESSAIQGILLSQEESIIS